MTRKLLVWDPGTGAVSIMQSGGTDKSVIDRYEELGDRAGFFDQNFNSFEDIFIHREKVMPRPRMLARFINTKVDQQGRGRIRADGQDYAQIAGVPAGAYVHATDGMIEQVIERADGKVLPFAVDIPSHWIISIQCDPYYPQRFELIAE